MKNFLLLFLFLILFSLPSRQQTRVDSTVQRNDSVPTAVNDSVGKPSPGVVAPAADRAKDSIIAAATEKQLRQRQDNFQRVLNEHPVFLFSRAPVKSNLFVRKDNDNEALFYFLVGVIFYFGCIRLFFGKYLDNLVTLFFRVTMRQQQIREQLLQTPLPSLLLNILFVISSALYLALLARYYQLPYFSDVWITFLYAIAFVSAIYLGKYFVLKFTGWIFNVRSATDTYIFIVFLVNKMIGIFLLPFIVLISFPNEIFVGVVVLLSYIMLVLFWGYRFINSYRPIRTEIKVSRFHFFLYLCAFEIAPLLLIYKVLLAYVEHSN